MVRTLSILTAAALALVATAATANPLGGQVKGGSATIAGEGTATVTVTQSTDRAVIDWRTFDIGADESTRFAVPKAGSITLNRITGGLGPSSIYGRLSSNGQLVLINPNGILFGAGAVVDAAGLVATSHDIADADFMAGGMVFDLPGNPSAAVINAGTITVSDGGFAALVAPGVRNEGIISARLGKVGLAAGNGFTLDLYGDGLINLKVGDEIAAEVMDMRSGKALSSLVSNAGTLKADGGRVALTAVTARRVVDSVINNSGVIEANAVARKGGTIILGAATASTKTTGAPTQTVKVSGKLTAAGQGASQTGGKIQVTGEQIRIADARLDASGAAGGGTVLVGGDRSGGKAAPAGLDHPLAALESEAVPTASRVVIEPSVTIDVSATDRGDGGKAIVWSDTDTTFAGTILATGGPNGGNGGFVEISSAGLLTADLAVDVSAVAGTIGTILLDPDSLDVARSAQDCRPGRSCVTVGQARGGIFAVAWGDIYFNTAFTTGGAVVALSLSGSIYVKAAFSARDVVFVASGGSVVFDAKVTATRDLFAFARDSVQVNAGLTAGEALTLWADRGDINIAAAVAATDLYLDARRAVTIGANATVLGSVAILAGTIDIDAALRGAAIELDASERVRLGGTVAATGSLEVTAPRLDIDAGATVSATDVTFDADTATVAGSVVARGRLAIAADAIDLPGTLRGAAIELDASERVRFGGTVAATGLLDVTAPRLDIAAGATVSATDARFDADTATVAGSVTARGALDIEAQWLASTGLLRGDSVRLRLTPAQQPGLGGLDNRGTIAGATVEISAAGGALAVGGTIELLAGGPASRLSVVNTAGSVDFAAVLALPAGHPALVSMVASGALTVESALAVQGATLLYAGTDLRILGDIGFTDVTLPDAVARPAGLDLAGQSVLVAVGATVSGRGVPREPGATAGGNTRIGRSAAGTGTIAIVEQTADVQGAAYLDGLTASGLAAAFAPLAQLTGAGDVPKLAPVTAALSRDALASRGIDVPAPPTVDQPVTPPAAATADPARQIVIPSPNAGDGNDDRAVVELSEPAGDGGQGGGGQGGQSGGGQGGPGSGGTGGHGDLTGALPPMPRTFDVPPPTETRFLRDEVLVHVDPKLSPEQVAAIERQFGLTPLARQSFGLGGFSFGRYRIPAGMDLRAVIAALSGNRGVMVGQPNYTYALSEDAAGQDAARTAPAEGSQPASAPAHGLPGGPQLQYAVEKLRLAEAHRQARGREVVVAVIDSPIDASHPEIKDALHKVIDATGGGEAAPDVHGTGMAGALAARASLTGTAPGATILGITAFRNDGKGTQGTTLSILTALDLAHREGARVVNMSFAGPRDPLLSRAIAEARRRGMILVAAAGNGGPQSPPLYPAADPNVIAVTAIDADDNAFAMANRGSYVTVAAPGVDVLVPVPGNAYEFTSGTSVATAEVSGLVALMLERDPVASAEDIRQALISSARDLGPEGPDPVFGAGAADAAAALQAIEHRTTVPPHRPIADGVKPERPLATAPGRTGLTPASLPQR
ncbi:S8 family serine peptidase [Blastochloris viridis]|uniref:Probable extracellular protease n=1 Tax=Blastochloris viridis TaxID=1079 RepID=A0A0H5BFF4_BLAVI|nr:S8 family serine peptidase [Blastochloris viridis]ALK09205.1 Thermophilic serine proteinase precursor [Blastochloris viridis]BAS00928.1 probable extracellular protease [Blastochloris viridis]CUU41868.1 Thermophilic serine proteinase precursor [Blastochloris viridis]